MSTDAYFCNITMAEYLADRGRTSGSVLSLVDQRPEDYSRWLAGKLRDDGSPGLNQGSFFHCRVTEPDEVSRRFAFIPNRNQAPDKDGKPQDPSPDGADKRMMTNNKLAKAYWREFVDTHKGLIFIEPEQLPVVNAMVRAVWNHEHAAQLLRPEGFGPEVTGHFTCPITGEPMRFRPDGLRLEERVWVELKSYTPKGDRDRLDTLDERAVVKWAREGWGRKSAIIHDGCRAITGDDWTGYWIVVEAVEHDPRVSVVRDRCEAVPCLYSLGRDGSGSIRGYLELVRQAQTMREEGDFRAECVREVVTGWPLPDWLVNDMLLEDARRNPVIIKGARQAAVAHG